MRRFTAVIALLAVATLAAAPVFANGQQEGAEGEDGVQTITYYLWEDPTIERVIDAFEESQDEIVVDRQIVSAADYETKMATLLAGGAEMDAYMQKRQADMFPHYASGYIEPLDDLASERGFDLDMISAYVPSLQIEGNLVAIPFRAGQYYTYYNEAVFEDAGIPTPDTYVENGEWTWAKFEEVANEIATGDGEVYGGLIYTWGSQHTFPAFQEGVQFITPDGEIDINDSVVESLNMRKRLEENEAIVPLVELKATKTHYSQAFYAGNVGMLLIGEWFPGMMLKAKEDGLLRGYTWDEWGITRLPSDVDPYTAIGNPTFSHVHADSDQKEAAFDFIAWMGGPEGAEYMANAGFLTPVMTEGVREELSAVIPDESSLDYFTEEAAHSPMLLSPYGSRVDLFLGDLTEAYMQGDIERSELEQELIEGLEEIIETTN
ncbi:MAG: ABC transporter substrate-binding protein [Spirochaetota bacterium]